MVIELSLSMRTQPPRAFQKLSKISTRLSETGLCVLRRICPGLTMVLEPAESVGIDWLVASLDGIFGGDVIDVLLCTFLRVWWLQCIANLVLHGLSHSFISPDLSITSNFP